MKYMHEGKEVLKVDIKQSAMSRADAGATFHFVDGTTTTEDDTSLIIERVGEWCEKVGWVKQGSDSNKFAWVPPQTVKATTALQEGDNMTQIPASATQRPEKRPEPSDKSGTEQPPVKKQKVSVELQGPFGEIGILPSLRGIMEQPVKNQNATLKASFELRGPLGTIGIRPGMEYGKMWTKLVVGPGDRAVLEEKQQRALNPRGSSAVGDIKNMSASETWLRYKEAVNPKTMEADMLDALMQSEKGGPGFEYHWTNTSEDCKIFGEVMLVSGHIVEMEKGIDWSSDTDKKQLARMQQAEDEYVNEMTSM